MNKLTTDRLEKFVNDIKTDGMCDITDSQVQLALIRLLAYEQAADRPVGEIFICSGNKTLRWLNDVPEGTVLYAAPVLPKQPRWPAAEVERDALRYRFLRDKDFFGDEDEPGLVGWEGLVELGYNEFDAAVDARISHPDIDYVKLDTALRKHIPAQPVIPEQPEPTISFYRDGIIAAAKWVENQRDAYDNEHGQSDPDTGAFEFGNNAQLEYSTTLSEIAEGIRSLHSVSEQPVSEPYKLPSGWMLVPIEPTENMIIDGFESEPDKTFSKPEVWAEYAAMSGCKQAAHRAKLCWAAMLTAAPVVRETNND